MGVPLVLHGTLVECLTCNPEVLWQDTSEPQPNNGKTQERYE